MNVTNRFLKYVSFDTQSDESSDIAKQLLLAEVLKEEMQAMGLTEISLDEQAYLMATLPANTDKNVPVIGFIAHLDTSPDMSGTNVKPRIVEKYDGKDIILNKENNI
ncbi:MAG: peptidase T, partial [Dysgonamonadaceae bacterium]|nr:peptidase T [Dysgonamonadaceae bacterium]